ncbi:antibiotic biosynthesis monooxygenase [uncultured Azohydromonas sp.]|jgi:Uncharacterized enzyme involved in biosynthesis of extracellular polysaccharides|uniref:antibiotic biosynthesis monooxygenase family protein n=1 Tax=uncultured Azohydromonas sp. TaxID=487342 RepID=UPI002629A112|nr:antibiotic biosynthesis monooxygenase [uncultured Azohydromonas sp.]
MYSSTFIFAKKQFDAAFHKLYEGIAARARAIPGYLGEESWENTATGLVSNVYYWDSLEALRQLVRDPSHLEAKAGQARWLNGYRVIVAEVVRSYGDDGLDGLLPTLPALPSVNGTGPAGAPEGIAT